MKHIAVFGANGQLGADIMELMSLDHANYALLGITRKQVDITDLKALSAYLETIAADIDILVNCTAMTDTALCEKEIENAYKTNACPLYEMANFCRRHNKLLFHISTDYVFDGNQGDSSDRLIAYREDARANPINVYGLSKLASENILKAYHNRFFIFRVSSLFGTRGASGKSGNLSSNFRSNFRSNFIDSMVGLAKEQKEIRLISDQIMSPTHTMDVAKAIKVFIDKDINEYGTYNVVSAGQCSWYDLAAMTFSLTGLNPSITAVSHTEFKSEISRPQYSVLDNTKVSQILTMPHWKDALAAYLKRKGYLN